MDKTLSFVVTIKEEDLKDFALNSAGADLGDVPNPLHLAEALKDVIVAGLNEYLGEDDTSNVIVKPMTR